MSKAIGNFAQKIKGIKNAPTKFKPSATEGSRILPSKTKDGEYQLRIDAGHYDEKTKLLNVVLQVNSQAKSPGLRDWARKNTTHEKLATASFDTGATDQKAEFNSVVDTLEKEAKKKLG
ncbi:MAG: hypothetical protein L6R39_003023 [Caloplaca ligustica]|nr:MAG: hypothetical protein L6R39_003023 [Caloplaca ligustica]